MKLRNLFISLFLIGCLGAIAAASDKVVKISAGQSPYKIKQGTAAQIEVIIDINAGFHINSNRPGDEFLIPTALKLDRLEGITTTRIIYPKAKIQKFPFSEKPLSVYEGRAVLKFTARALTSKAPGNYNLKGKLTVQACNNEACLRPATIDVSVPIEVVSAK